MGACSRPIPRDCSTQATIDITRRAPTGSSVLAEVDGKEHQPERLVDLSLAPAQHRSFQRVKEVTQRIRSKIAEILRANHRNVSNAANALYELFDESFAICRSPDARKRTFPLIKCTQPRVELLSETAVLGPHEIASFAVRAIHRRIAAMTCVVTPKLLWML